MLNKHNDDSSYLGQFIPLHYHHNMLMSERRMQGFKEAIERVVMPEANVLELGGGTGVLSWFAAAKADKVWCVEFNPDMVKEARRLLELNFNGHKVEVVQADAFDYLPPEPVDVVICEMIHVAMIREKQVEVIEKFKQRYRQRFGDPLPLFIPEAVVMGVQPLQQNYDFWGYHAPIIQFQIPGVNLPDSLELAEPQVYSTLDFNKPNDFMIEWEGDFTMACAGKVNALRFITRNVLAVLLQNGKAIDWLNDYMVLPLNSCLTVEVGDILHVSFKYHVGCSIPALQQALQVRLLKGAQET